MATLKMVLTFLLVLLIQASYSQTSGWTEQESGTEAQLNEIFFVDMETGWAVGDEIILGTQNGGETWTIQDSSEVFFWSVFFTDQDHGWTVGFPSDTRGGRIFRTIDGGLHWQVQDSTEVTLHDICFVDADTGYICGGGPLGSLILKSTDGGETWDINLDNSFHSLSAIHFSDHQHGWAVGAQGEVIITENSGKLWKRGVSRPDVGYSYLYDIQFFDQNTGWCLGAGYLFKSTNGGDDWELKSDPDYFLYTALHFYNASTGWLLAGYQDHFFTNRILHTSDGGAFWQIQPSTQSDNMSSIFFIDDKIGWVVGFNGLILKTTNGGITSIDEYSSHLKKFELSQNYPNPFNPVTVINYQLPITSFVELSIVNLIGQKVVTLVSEGQSVGNHQVQWDASGFAAGVYYYQLKAGEYQEVKKMVLLR